MTSNDPTYAAAYRERNRERIREYDRTWRARNRTPRLVDATHAREHVARLVAEGSTIRAISQRSGISHTTIKELLTGRQTITSYTARQLLAVPVVYGVRIPAAGTSRRIRALNAIGWANSHLGARLGVTRDRVAQYANAAWVERDTAAKVAAVYDELSMTPGPSTRSRTWAAKRGYMPPLAWDDETIDDPSAWASPGEDHDPDIDDVLVQRLVEGEDWRTIGATKSERIAAAEILDARYRREIGALSGAALNDSSLDRTKRSDIERHLGLRAGRDFALHRAKPASGSHGKIAS